MLNKMPVLEVNGTVERKLREAQGAIATDDSDSPPRPAIGNENGNVTSSTASRTFLEGRG